LQYDSILNPSHRTLSYRGAQDGQPQRTTGSLAKSRSGIHADLRYAQASLATAEQLLKLNLDAARNSIEQAGKK